MMAAVPQTKNSSRASELRQRAEGLAALHAVALDITPRQDLPSLLLTLTERAVRLLDGSSGTMYLCYPDRDEVHCAASFNTPQDYTGIMLRYGEGAAGVVASTGKPLIIDDYRNWPGRARVYDAEQSFRSVVSVPIGWQGQQTGVIQVIHLLETHFFGQQDVELLTLFASLAAIALDNFHFFEAIQKQARHLTVLNQITTTSLESKNLPEMLQSLADQMCELLEADSCYMTLWDEESQQAIPAAACGALRGRYPHIAIQPGQKTLTASGLEIGQPLAIEDTSNSPYLDPGLAAQMPDHSVLALPLIAGGQKYGAAIIGHNRRHVFSRDEIESGQQAAAQAALAVAKTRLLERQIRSLEEMQALQATAADISTVLELPGLLRAILERACMLLNAIGGDLCLFDDERGDLEIVTNYNMGTDYSGTRIALGQGAAGHVAITQSPLIIDDYQNWERRIPQYNGGPWQAVLVVPMLVASRLVGVIGVFDDNPKRRFTPSDEKLLALLAQQSAIAIENARLYDVEKKRAAELALLFESSTNITRTIDLRAVLNITAEQLASAANATSAYVLSYDQEKGEALVLADYYSPEANEMEKTTSDLGVKYDLKITPGLFDALRSGKAWRMRVGDPGVDAVSRHELIIYGIKSALALPMMLAGNVHAYAEIWDSRSDRDWSQEEVRLCQTLANQATITIENARLFDETQRLAVTDPLTGLYNRRGLFQLGERELERVRRFGHPLAAIMLDIDHFKQINDSYSHAAGDEVLRAVGDRCRELIRDTDILGRYGGEEFALLLPETDIPGAYRVAERLRTLASAAPVATARGPIHITISLGLTAFSADIPDLAVLLDHADTAMYSAKQEGRDRVVIG